MMVMVMRLMMMMMIVIQMMITVLWQLKREKGVEREKMSVTCKELVEYIKEQMPVNTVIVIVIVEYTSRNRCL